jgi:mitochondrial import receptor subunit TOM70
MSGESAPVIAAPPPGSPSSSLWDRVSTWASENKAVVYTIAGTAIVVTGAGVVYYLSESRKSKQSASISEGKRKSKKERRKEKKAAEEGKSATSGARDEEAGMPINQDQRISAKTTQR